MRHHMQRHWKAFLVLGLALTAYIVVIMAGSYFAAIAVVLAAFFGTGAYLIAIARFKNRPDPPDDEHTSRPTEAR